MDDIVFADHCDPGHRAQKAAEGFDPDARVARCARMMRAAIADSPADMVIGRSMVTGRSANERCILSLGIAEPDATKREMLEPVRGEAPDKMTLTERHRQATIRLRVAPCPCARGAGERHRKPAHAEGPSPAASPFRRRAKPAIPRAWSGPSPTC
jgi:hypothetical protein